MYTVQNGQSDGWVFFHWCYLGVGMFLEVSGHSRFYSEYFYFDCWLTKFGISSISVWTHLLLEGIFLFVADDLISVSLSVSHHVSLSALIVTVNSVPSIITSYRSPVVELVLFKTVSLPLPAIWTLSFISKYNLGLSKVKVVLANGNAILVAFNKRINIRILMRVIRLTNGKPCRCYYTCGHRICMTWVISLNNLTVIW